MIEDGILQWEDADYLREKILLSTQASRDAYKLKKKAKENNGGKDAKNSNASD